MNDERPIPLDTLVCPYLAIARRFKVDYGDVLLFSEVIERSGPGSSTRDAVIDRLMAHPESAELQSRIIGSLLDWWKLQIVGMEEFQANRPKWTLPYDRNSRRD